LINYKTISNVESAWGHEHDFLCSCCVGPGYFNVTFQVYLPVYEPVVFMSLKYSVILFPLVRMNSQLQ